MRTLLGLLLLACAGLELGPAALRDRSGDDAQAVAPESAGSASIDLQELRRGAAPWLGRRLRLVVQFGGRREDWNPWVTRFGPEEFAAYRVWGDEQFLWEHGAWQDPFPYLFARRGSQAEVELRYARDYWRYELIAVPRELFLGLPWIEVLSARRLPREVGEGTILHAGRALQLGAEGRFELAEGELERAGAGVLPAHARAELERLEEVLERERRRVEQARVARRRGD